MQKFNPEEQFDFFKKITFIIAITLFFILAFIGDGLVYLERIASALEHTTKTLK